MRNTCIFVLGIPIDAGRLIFCCWHVAANRELLKAGREVPPGCSLWGKLWAPVEIVHAKPGQSFKGTAGYILTFRVIDGPLCPVHFERWFPNKFLWTIAKILEHMEPPGYRQARPRPKRKLEPLLPIINEILKQDQHAPRKQRHTAKRIFDRLRTEHGMAVATRSSRTPCGRGGTSTPKCTCR